MTRLHYERPDGSYGNAQTILEHLNEFVPPQGYEGGEVIPPEPVIENLLKVTYPSHGNIDYNNYKFYQISKGQIIQPNGDVIIRIEDTIGSGKFLEPSGFDIRAFHGEERDLQGAVAVDNSFSPLGAETYNVFQMSHDLLHFFGWEDNGPFLKEWGILGFDPTIIPGTFPNDGTAPEHVTNPSEANGRDIWISKDGNYFMICGVSQNTAELSTLTTPYTLKGGDTLVASFDMSFLGTVASCEFTNDGKFFNAMIIDLGQIVQWQVPPYTFPAPFTAPDRIFPYNPPIISTNGNVRTSDNGNHMYIVSDSPNQISKYELDENYVIPIVNKLPESSVDLTSVDSSIRGITISDDESRIWLSGRTQNKITELHIPSTELLYNVISVDTITGKFTVDVTIPNGKDFDFFHLSFGNPSATNGSTVITSGETLLTENSPLLTKDTPTILVNHPYWFDADWKFRIPLKVNDGKVPSPQTDFPLLISGTYTELIGKTKAEIRFVGIDRIPLEYEITEFDNTTGTIVAWAKKPLLSDGDIIYIYADNPNAVDAQNKSAVWGDDYNLVYHMNLVGNQVKDSTINGNDGNVFNAIDTEGKVGRGLFFDGNNDEIRPTSIFENPNNWTISVWGIKEGSSTSVFMIDFQTDRTIIAVRVNDNFWAFSNNIWHDTGINATDKFHQVVLSHNGTTTKVYVDAILTNTIDGSNPGGLLGIGGDWPLTQNSYEGKIDEIHMPNVELLQDRITTNFNNQNNPSEFLNPLPQEELKVIEVKN